MIKRDIWIAANEMIKLYGEDAVVKAAIRADALNDDGNAEGYAVWQRIIAAINELRSTEQTGKPN